MVYKLKQPTQIAVVNVIELLYYPSCNFIICDNTCGLS